MYIVTAEPVTKNKASIMTQYNYVLSDTKSNGLHIFVTENNALHHIHCYHDVLDSKKLLGQRRVLHCCISSMSVPMLIDDTCMSMVCQ